MHVEKLILSVATVLVSEVFNRQGGGTSLAVQKSGGAYWTHRFPKGWLDTFRKVEVHSSRVEPMAMVSFLPFGFIYLR